MTTLSLKLERKPEVLCRLGLSNTSLYDRIKKGLLPPPINLGGRAVGWLSHEIDAVIASMAAGKSTEELTALVNQLVKQRQELAA